jgi:maleate isomerase
MKSPEKDIIKLSFQTDAGIGSRARIGLLVLQTDQTIEHEVAQLTAFDGVACYHARLPNNAAVSSTTLEKMEEELPQAARLLAPELGLTSLGYACTSGSSIIGEARVNQILKSIHPGVPSSNPLEAAKAAFSALDVSRIGLVTPYTPEVTRSVEDNFARSEIRVSVVGSFYEKK